MYAIVDGEETEIPGEVLNKTLGYVPHAAIQGYTVKTGEEADAVHRLLGFKSSVRQPQNWVFQSNPDVWDLRDFLIAETQGRFATNQHREKISTGDRIWFRVTGKASGIYAIGEVAGPPTREANDFGESTAPYRISKIIDPPILTTEIKNHPTLCEERSLTGYQYTNASLSEAAANALMSLVADRTVSPDDEGQIAFREIDTVINPLHSSRRGGQGFGLSQPKKVAVEKRAVAVATQFLESEGWRVEDVGSNRSYDLHCAKDSEILTVEAKGSTTPAETVQLTYREVEHHHENYPHTALMVVSQITLVEIDGTWQGQDGMLSMLRRWKPDFEALTALSYRYRVPESYSH